MLNLPLLGKVIIKVLYTQEVRKFKPTKVLLKKQCTLRHSLTNQTLNQFEEIVTGKTLKWLDNEQLSDLNYNCLNDNN